MKMKKYIVIFALLLLTPFLVAEEKSLLDTSVKSDIDGYDFISNFEVTSDSGWFNSKDLTILNNDDGIVVKAENVPQYTSTNYKIIPAYPAFLNEPNVGAGYIDNASAIKSITITYRVNRSYDEVFLLYSDSPAGPVKEVKIPQDFNATQSMVFQTITYEMANYISDVNKKEIKSYPIIGSPANGIYFRGIKIQTNMPTGYMAYGSTSVVQIKEVKVVYDNAKTQEQLDSEKEYSELFGIDTDKTLKEKELQKIKEKNRIKEHNKSLMDNSSDAK